MKLFGNIEGKEVREISQSVGVVGDGQLAMLAYWATKKLGIILNVYGEKKESPVGRFEQAGKWSGDLVLAEKNVDGTTNWTDGEALAIFENIFPQSSPITTEWENVPARVFEELRKMGLTTCPPSHFLSQIQDRISEKELIQKSGGEAVPYKDIVTKEDVEIGVREFGKSRLKSRKGGYDGGKQWTITSENAGEVFEKPDVQEALQKGGLILEKVVDIDSEVSVIAGIDQYGNVVCFDPIVNYHSDGILRTSISGISLSKESKSKVLEVGTRIAESFSAQDYVGLLTIEMFVTADGQILVNEFAPRPHNSGHITLDNNSISQFELWLRSVRGENIGKLDLVSAENPGIMVNILSQQEMLKVRERVGNILDGKGSALVGEYSVSVYDYQKVLPEQLTEGDVLKRRKLGHINITKKEGNISPEVAYSISRVQGNFEHIWELLKI